MEFYHHNFKTIRESRGLTLEQVGKSLEPPISKQTVQRWESGAVSPLPKRLKQLARVLRCSVVDLSDLPAEGWLVSQSEGDNHLTAHMSTLWQDLDTEERAQVIAFAEGLKKKTAVPTVDNVREA